MLKAARRMPGIAVIGVLLRPRIMPLFKRGLTRSVRGGRTRLLVLGAAGAAFWCGLFAVAWRVLVYFRGIEEIGDILSLKLLSMILIVCFALLLFSSILTSLSKLYLSRDLLLVHSLPVSRHRLFLARWLDGTVDSGWMVLLFTLPVFLAYGIVFGAGPAYYGATLFSLTALALIASALSALAVMIGVILVPAGRMRSIVIVLGVLLFVALYVAIRLSRPEQLVNPEVFETVLAYIASLQAPVSPLLPSTWAFDSIRAIFAKARMSKERNYTAGTFSFNSGDGRCPTCGGNGFEHVEMQFLSDVYLRCPDCDGKRFRAEVLEVALKGKSIADVLELTVSEALTFFADRPEVLARLAPLADVGLEYLRLGQPVPTLSGGEAQRLKLAGHLADSDTAGRPTLFLFDEPTTGLHFDDIAKLLKSFRRLIAAGHSLVASSIIAPG